MRGRVILGGMVFLSFSVGIQIPSLLSSVVNSEISSGLIKVEDSFSLFLSGFLCFGLALFFLFKVIFCLEWTFLITLTLFDFSVLLNFRKSVVFFFVILNFLGRLLELYFIRLSVCVNSLLLPFIAFIFNFLIFFLALLPSDFRRLILFLWVVLKVDRTLLNQSFHWPILSRTSSCFGWISVESSLRREPGLNAEILSSVTLVLRK